MLVSTYIIDRYVDIWEYSKPSQKCPFLSTCIYDIVIMSRDENNIIQVIEAVRGVKTSSRFSYAFLFTILLFGHSD